MLEIVEQVERYSLLMPELAVCVVRRSGERDYFLEAFIRLSYSPICPNRLRDYGPKLSG